MGGAPADDRADQRFVVPCEIIWYKERPLVGLAEVSLAELDQPYWLRTIKQRQLVALRSLDDPAPDGADFSPRGMIYSLGRCGTTLVAALLSLLPDVYVLREPHLYSTLFAPADVTAADRIRWLRNLGAAYATGLGARAQHLVMKWESPAIFRRGLVSAAFPGVPALFLWRDPVEVLVSMCASRPSMNQRFRMEWFSADLKPDYELSPSARESVDFMARMLASFCDGMAGMTDVRMLDYRSLPGAAWSKICPFFGFSVGEDDRLRMVDLARFDAKSPQLRAFHDDSPLKQQRADATVRALADRFIVPRLKRLEAVLRPL